MSNVMVYRTYNVALYQNLTEFVLFTNALYIPLLLIYIFIITHSIYGCFSIRARTVEIPSFKRSLMVAPLQWLSAIMNYISAPYIRFTRVQSQQNMTTEHAYKLINKYRVSYFFLTKGGLFFIGRGRSQAKAVNQCRSEHPQL